jgi:hypothetical protein
MGISLHFSKRDIWILAFKLKVLSQAPPSPLPRLGAHSKKKPKKTPTTQQKDKKNYSILRVSNKLECHG